MAQWQLKGTWTFSTNQVLSPNGSPTPSQSYLDFSHGSQLALMAVVANTGTIDADTPTVVQAQISIDASNWATWDKQACSPKAGVTSELPFTNIPDGWPYVRFRYIPGDKPATVTFAIGAFGANFS